VAGCAATGRPGRHAPDAKAWRGTARLGAAVVDAPRGGPGAPVGLGVGRRARGVLRPFPVHTAVAVAVLRIAIRIRDVRIPVLFLLVVVILVLFLVRLLVFVLSRILDVVTGLGGAEAG
jgi:hypothetical protein